MTPSRIPTQFFVIMSYTNLYDYPSLGLIDLFSLYVNGLYQKRSPKGCHLSVMSLSNMRLSKYIKRI